MNASIRRLTVLTLVMFVVLMGAASWIQFAQAGDLNADARNRRTLYHEYDSFRGPIVVDGQAIAYSVPVDDPFRYQRTYVDGEMYAPVVGFYSVVYGRSGIEQAENTLLNGTSDALFWSRLGDLLSGEEQRGASVELTLRASLQRVAYDALGDQRGVVVALDPRTGAILAMVSKPSYDPALLATHDTSVVVDNYEALLADPSDPLINRAIAGDTYAPGSLFKVVTAAAALESGLAPDSAVYAPVSLALPLTTTTIHNYGGKACDETETTTLGNAFRKSCNTPFANFALDLGWGPIERKAQEFGWGGALAIPMTVTPSRLPVNPDGAQAAMSAIGQYEVRVTPLLMAMVGAAVANDGTIMQPHLVAQARDSDLGVIYLAEPSPLGTPLKGDDAIQLTEMMIAVVESGTGTAARIPGVVVAGKTGTAEAGGDRAPHAWFLGFAPADDPVIVVVVLVENGGDMGDEATGGKVAAPIARSVIAEALRLNDESAEGGTT